MFRFLLLASFLISASQGFSTFTSSSASLGIQNGATMVMKKGKPNVPSQMRGQYKRQQEMQQQKEAMIEAQTPGADGLPVFNLFVRTIKGNMWYPCGSFKGDDRSKALCTTYADDGFFSGISKKQLDSGIAGSLYQDLDRLVGTVVRAYPQLKKSQKNLEFGYKLAFKGLKEQSEPTIVEPKEQKGGFDAIKTLFS